MVAAMLCTAVIDWTSDNIRFVHAGMCWKGSYLDVCQSLQGSGMSGFLERDMER